MTKPPSIPTLDYTNLRTPREQRGVGLRVEGASVVGPTQMVLPAVCVITGATNGLVVQRQSVTHAGKRKWALVAFFGIAGLFASSRVTDKGVVSFYVSQEVLDRKRRLSRVALLWALASIAVLGYGVANELWLVALIGCIGAVAGFVWPKTLPPNLRAVRFEEDEMELRGFGDEFLKQLMSHRSLGMAT